MTTTPGTSISPEVIASMKQSQAGAMPEVVTVYHRVVTRDSRGGETATWPPPGVPTIGRVGKVRDELMVAFAGQLRGKATATLAVPVGSGVQQQDKVNVLGGTYLVVADMSRSSYATAARFLIEEV